MLSHRSYDKNKHRYPEVWRDESIINKYQGMKIIDPYRWLENLDSRKTKEFIYHQNALTARFLEACRDRENIKRCLTKAWNYPRFSCPIRRGDSYYFYHNSGLQEQNVLYVKDSLNSEERVFFDPNKLSANGTTAVIQTSFSQDGSTFAYGLSTHGSEWVTVHFMRSDNGEKYLDQLRSVKYSNLAWTRDGVGMFYARYSEESLTAPLQNQSLFYHVVGTAEEHDVLVASFPDHPNWRIGATVSNCGRYLLVLPREGVNENQVLYADLIALQDGVKGKLNLHVVVGAFEAEYAYVTNECSQFVFLTNKDAPNRHLIQMDIKDLRAGRSVLLAESLDSVLCWANVVGGNKLVICYIKNMRHVLQLRDLKTCSLLMEFPFEMGKIDDFSGSRQSAEIFFRFSSFVCPGIIYKCDTSSSKPKLKVYQQMKLEGLHHTEYVVHQKTFKSKDGTQVPMSIVHQKGVKINGESPCLLHGYGGYGFSFLPTFSVLNLVFMKHFNGIVAIAHVRGGGENGVQWHHKGRKMRKQTGLNDFIKAAEFLIENSFASKKTLIAHGYSNGGLLVAASINQRPDLFGAALILDGIFDLLRFDKFTIGHAWMREYGSPSATKEFENLLKISPLHNINMPREWNCQYPSIFLLTGDHDDRVVPMHSLKFIAQLQHVLKNYGKQTNPLLLRFETDVGHGIGKPITKVIARSADILAFLVNALELKFQE